MEIIMQSQSTGEIESKVYDSRTDVFGRLNHFIGDWIIVVLTSFCLGSYLYHLTGLDFFKSELYYALMMFGYYWLMESLFQKTLFKYLTGSVVVTSDGTKPQSSIIAVRSLIRFLPFEPISVLFGRQDERWWHDIWTKTYVVQEAKLKATLKE